MAANPRSPKSYAKTYHSGELWVGEDCRGHCREVRLGGLVQHDCLGKSHACKDNQGQGQDLGLYVCKEQLVQDSISGLLQRNHSGLQHQVTRKGGVL